ncbi:MAG: AAA family ATPase [Candidatus Rokubacteria bacterium]|nr:AAA family ATPase [Candidatus Rokubacteria bacterium]
MPDAAICPACRHANPRGARFCNECGCPLTADAAPHPDEAERRHLTVMFTDLVGSTALADALDPEELRTVIRAYQDMVAKVIDGLEGHVAQYLGDGVLAYFGYPRAHEDDARRAVRAALGILAAAKERSTSFRAPLGVELAVRIGIHTGLVVIGEVGSRGRPEHLALGGAPNVAARLEAIAQPGTAVISGATARLVQGAFVLRDRGTETLRGVATPIRVWEVLGESAGDARLEPLGSTPLVGRDRELAQLLECWRGAAAGAGRVVMVTGDPGIGKSRLVKALRERLGGGPHRELVSRCSAYHTQSAFHPMIDLAGRALGFTRDDSVDARLERLRTVLAHYGPALANTLPLFAELLSLPAPAGYTESAQRQRRRTFAAIVALLAAVAAEQPLLLVVEDLHWADPSTLELLALLVERVARTPALVVMTARPEFRALWPAAPHVSAIALGRLSGREVAEVVEHVAGDRALPAVLVAEIEAKTDGVPLYVEELTKMVVESGIVRETGGRLELIAPVGSLAIPATLQESLLARLDQLGPAKSVAQLGATVGREFTWDVLHAVSPLDAAMLEDALTALVEAELLAPLGAPPHVRYAFKHALVQDAAYQSLLRSTRQQHHRRIAEALVSRFSDLAEREPEVLAHHYTEAGLVDSALTWWKRAGRRASARSACLEAVAHLTRGLALLPAIPDPADRAQHELDLQTLIAPALMAVRSPTAPEVEQAYARARELCVAVGATPKLVFALEGLWAFYFVRGKYGAAFAMGERLLELAARFGTNRVGVIAHQAHGTTLLHMGQLARALEHLVEGTKLYERRAPDADEAFREVNDPGVMCLAFQGQALCLLGRLDEAQERAEEAIALARECAHPFSQAFALCASVLVAFGRNQPAYAVERVEKALAVSRDHGFPLWWAASTILAGWVAAATGRPEHGLAQLRRGLAGWDSIGAGNLRPYYLTLLADACRVAGEVDAGLVATSEALAAVEATGERLWEAEIHRLEGELLRLRGSAAKGEVEACYTRALEIARGQGAQLLEKRASASLWRLTH